MTNDTQPKRRYAKRLPKAQRREHLLEAALLVLDRDGYENLTIEAIAREADVTRPVVYSAYDGLGPLLDALLDRTQRRALASALRLMPDREPTGSVADWLLEVADGFFDVVISEPAVWKPVLGLTANAPVVVRDRIDGTKELIRGYIADGLRVEAEVGEGPEADFELLAHLVVESLEHFARLHLADVERYPKVRLLDALTSVLAPTSPGAGA